MTLEMRTKIFIDIKKSLKPQFATLSDYYTNIDFQKVDDKISSSLSSLLETNPDLISMELTHEQSAFYTLKKNDLTFFFQHYLNVTEEDDEAILSVFKGRKKLPSYAGNLLETISVLNSILTTCC